MEIKNVKIAEIKPYANNAKTHPEEQVEKIANSIKAFGFKQPLVLEDDGTIIIGHGRFAAAKKLGLNEVPCIYASDLNEAQIKALRLADNKVAESEWDFLKLDGELEELNDLFDFDMSPFGFDTAADDEEEKEIQEDEAPEPPTEPKAKLGDLYILGNSRLICGDSTDVTVIDRLMNGVKADMLLTDPPYNVDYTGKTKDALKIQNDKMDNDSFRQFLRDAFASADSVMRAGAVFYIWHVDSEGYNFRGACADNNWKVRECLIWNKNSMVMGRQDYQWKHEPCLYGWKDGASHLWTSDRKQTTILNFDRPNKADIHPTMKPVALFAYQMGNNTHEGDAVLDLFGGSGTTLIAAEQLKRKGYVCELDPHYIDAIIQRYINLKGTDEDVFLLKDGEKIPYSEL